MPVAHPTCGLNMRLARSLSRQVRLGTGKHLIVSRVGGCPANTRLSTSTSTMCRTGGTYCVRVLRHDAQDRAAAHGHLLDAQTERAGRQRLGRRRLRQQPQASPFRHQRRRRRRPPPAKPCADGTAAARPHQRGVCASTDSSSLRRRVAAKNWRLVELCSALCCNERIATGTHSDYVTKRHFEDIRSRR